MLINCTMILTSTGSRARQIQFGAHSHLRNFFIAAGVVNNSGVCPMRAVHRKRANRSESQPRRERRSIRYARATAM